MSNSYPIPSQAIVDSVDRLSPSLAEFDEKSEPLIRIDFSYYLDKVCEINYFNNKAKNALMKLKNIGKSRRSNLEENGIQLKPVYNAGDYSKLFKSTLPTDFEESMKEHCFSGTCRIFCVLEDNICYVIALTFSHFEVGRHRK